jgi:head-tail adaptor
MPGLDSGSLDKRVRFQTATRAKNAIGEAVASWAYLATPRWAKVIYGSGAERREAAVEDNKLAATFQLHWSAEIHALGADTGGARIVFDAVVWDIKSIAGSRRDGLSITAITRFDAP